MLNICLKDIFGLKYPKTKDIEAIGVALTDSINKAGVGTGLQNYGVCDKLGRQRAIVKMTCDGCDNEQMLKMRRSGKWTPNPKSWITKEA